MHGGWQLFSPMLLVEIEGSLLIRWVALYALASVWGRREMGKHTRALARLATLGRARAWRGEVRCGRDSLPKSGPKPRRPAASFYHLFLLRVRV
jgi:hypothetical protein